MDKDYAETDVISLNSLKKMSKYQDKIKCHGPILRSNSFGNVHSRYLKEPIGSCHNLCKYGRKHESEHDEKHLTFRRFMANSIALETGQYLVKVPSTVKKETVVKMEPSDTGKAVEENIQPKKVGIFDNSTEINMLTPLSGHRRTISTPQFIVPGLPNDEIIDAKFLNSSKNKKQVNKPKVSSMPKSTSVKGNILKQKNLLASTVVDSEDNTNILEEKILSNLKESTTSTPLEVIKQKNIVIRKQSASSKLQSNNQNASFSSKNTNSSATSTIPLNVRTPLLRMNQKEKILNSNEKPEVGEIKLPKPERISISSTISARSSVSLKTRKSRYAQHAILKKSAKTKDESGELKKIFEVIEPKIDGKSLEHRQNLIKELDGHAPTSVVGEASKHSSSGQIQRKYKHSTTSKEEDKRRARRIPAAQQPAESSSSPYKLKFKRGKVIELRTADSVIPRKLRFRSGRVLGENPSAEVMKRSYRRKKDIGDFNEHNSKAHFVTLKKANLESKVGMLKHQDAHRKKEIRTLFNHVIEETASKLVETRKSKVKALVGAFETVISLQEAKPASVL